MLSTTMKRPPFNTSTRRFGKITCHPNLDPQGLFSLRPPACDPCFYHQKPINEICDAIHKRFGKEPWRSETELENWSLNLGYRNEKILKQRKWDRSLLGPAWHTVPNPVEYQSACPNVGFGRTSRKIRSRNFTPGPGNYYKERPYKAPYGSHSTRFPFDREEPCRFKDTIPNWSLAPDRYIIRDRESIAEKSNKIVSLRGPYDLFSGTRDIQKPRCSASTWPLAFKGCLETLKKSHFGEMNKTNRDIPYRGRNALVDLSMCIRKPNDPGPAHYTVTKPKVFKKNHYGFNSSYNKPPGYQRAIVWPGVGRYHSLRRHVIEGHGHKHVFLSKVRRTIGALIPETMNTF